MLSSEQLYGLAIVSNRNLRSVSWKEQQNLWLGGRRDVRVLFLSNYLACEDDIMDLQLQFPSVVDSKDNGILAVCKMLIQCSQNGQTDRRTHEGISKGCPGKW